MRVARTDLGGIRPDEVEALLRKRSWILTDDRPAFSTWKRPDGELYVHVSRIPQFSDYPERVDEVLRLMQQVHGMDRTRVLNELEEATNDTLRLRDEGLEARWTTTLEEGRRLLDAAHQAWSDSARSLAQHEKDREKRRAQLQNFMESLRLGQTERGSYIVRVMAPVPAPQHVRQTELTPNPPFERKVTEHMVRAIGALSDAAMEVEGAPESAVRARFVEAARFGVTSKLCAAIASAAGHSSTRAIDIDVSWAQTFPTSPALSDPRAIRFEAELAPVLAAGADALRHHEQPRLMAIEGWVVRLHRERNQEGGEATVQAVLEPGSGARSVRIRLSEEDYEAAVNAHRDMRVIRCGGTLTRDGRRYELQNPNGFRALSEPEQTRFEDLANAEGSPDDSSNA